MKDGQPKTIDLFEAKYCYFWIECSDKNFPAHIISNIKGVEFEYYINFVNINDLRNFDQMQHYYKEKMDNNNL